VCIQAAPIVALEREPDEEALALRLLPINLEAALGLVRQQEQVRAITAVNAHAASARDVPHHRVARHRLTALRVAHHESIHALNPDALRAADAVDEPLERARLRGIRVRVQLGMDELENL